MSKGIIVTEIPCNCYECGNHNYHNCSWNGEDIEKYLNIEERHPKCPIQKLPEYKSDSGINNMFKTGKVNGWNECLDFIITLER